MKIKKYIDYALGKVFKSRMSREDMSMSALDVAIGTAVGNGIKGDYLEFGVYKGKSFARAFKQFASLNSVSDRRFFAFDSFAGLPTSGEQGKPEHYTSGAYSATHDTFIKTIKRTGVDLNKVETVPGFYNESLTEETKTRHNLSEASVVYIDVDLYESAVPVFEFLTDVLQNGSILVIDDWFRHSGTPKHGIQKACYDWLEKNPQIELIELHKWCRIAFIVHITE